MPLFRALAKNMAPMTNADESPTNRLTLFPIYLSLFIVSTLWLSINMNRMGRVMSPIDGLHLTSWRPCWRYNAKEYVINSVVGSSRRRWLTLSATSREIDYKPRIGIQASTIIARMGFPQGYCP